MNQVKDLIKTAKGAGLKINSQKSKIMQTNKKTTEGTEIEEEPVEELDEFCYHGSMVTNDGGAERDVNIRINTAKGTSAPLRTLWKSKEISRNTKLRIFNINVKSVLLYGCETWKITQNISHKLQTFVHRCLHIIINSRWPEVISNHDLWERIKQKPIATEITKKRK
jgi:DNA-binding winged helix-turn-helix (wHTH) protein